MRSLICGFVGSLMLQIDEYSLISGSSIQCQLELYKSKELVAFKVSVIDHILSMTSS